MGEPASAVLVTHDVARRREEERDDSGGHMKAVPGEAEDDGEGKEDKPGGRLDDDVQPEDRVDWDRLVGGARLVVFVGMDDGGEAETGQQHKARPPDRRANRHVRVMVGCVRALAGSMIPREISAAARTRLALAARRRPCPLVHQASGMARAASKKQAAQNAQMLRILTYGFLVTNSVHLLLVFGLFRKTSASTGAVVKYALTEAVAAGLAIGLRGMAKQGDDLSQSGLTS